MEHLCQIANQMNKSIICIPDYALLIEWPIYMHNYIHTRIHTTDNIHYVALSFHKIDVVMFYLNVGCCLYTRPRLSKVSLRAVISLLNLSLLTFWTALNFLEYKKEWKYYLLSYLFNILIQRTNIYWYGEYYEITDL